MWGPPGVRGHRGDSPQHGPNWARSHTAGIQDMPSKPVHHCTLVSSRTCVSTHHQWVGDGGTGRKGKGIPKLSFPSFLNPAPRELLRPFSFPGVSGQLPSPSMSVLIQFTMLEPLRRIFPQETGREAFPRPWAAVFLTLGAVRPHQHLSLPFLRASLLSQQKAFFFWCISPLHDG